MMPSRTSLADTAIDASGATPVRVVIVTLDNHLSGAAGRAEAALRREHPGLSLQFHAAADWESSPASLAQCCDDIGRGDIVIASMLFLDDHIKAVMPALEARRDACDAMVGVMSDAAVVKLTRLGAYRMDKPAKGPLALLKKLRGSSKPGTSSSGSGQMAMLKRLPKILRFIPGTAQDVRAYFLTLQYWLAGSDENFTNLVKNLVDRYADGPRRALRGTMTAAAPADYPELGVYHPRMAARMSERVADLPLPAVPVTGTVGLLVLRSYVLGSDTGHYDGVIAAFEARGLRVIPAFSSGLDARPAIDAFFMADGKPVIDTMVSLSGFSLVGGPAYNDSAAAAEALAKLDIPYLAAHPLEFQTLQAWGAGSQGLLPLEATMMVAIPELDGATVPTVFGGRSDGVGSVCAGCARGCSFPAAEGTRVMQPCPERAEALAARAHKLIDLRIAERANRKVALVIFNFPPNAGAVGTAAYLSVFDSVYNTLERMKAEGYAVDLPASVDALRETILRGNAERYGADANVAARIATDDHVRREPYLAEIEAQWGPAPGRSLADGHGINVLGGVFGNVFIGIQPPFGYEGDPMRLLFDGTFSPTHAFSAFYRWIREDFGAHAALHFGTHGALEFMPGKQAGLSAKCWPDRLIGDLPNFYLYASNNPSEGTIAKRRSNATLISYMTPPIAQSGLYKGLLDLNASIERFRATTPDAVNERAMLALLIQEQAAGLDLVPAEPTWEGDASEAVLTLAGRIYELEQTLIPHGLHIVGRGCTTAERVDLLLAIADAKGRIVYRDQVESLVAGHVPDDAVGDTLFADLAATDALLAVDTELDAIVRALDGRYIMPAPGGDVLRTPAVLPTGRNIHGFDPFRIPSAFACRDGAQQAQRLIDRHMADGAAAPESIAMVLWGTDNLKTEGQQIAQVMALMGARPRFDGYGRLCGAELTPLADLGRPRIDVVVTLSGIFRDLLPMQTRMIAEAAYLATMADEPEDMNFIRKHSLAHQAKLGCDLDTAALRVFSNAEGAYGANVNLMIDAGVWNDENELADAYETRKGFAYGRSGAPVRQAKMLSSNLSTVDLTYQNLDSVELGVTSVDQYVDSLGGISRSIARAKGSAAPVYIGDQTQGEGKVRTLGEQVALETRTRMLNPLWTEGMLKSGFEGVRQIEVHVTNTMGWSATTGDVAPWVYQRISETYVLDDTMRERLASLNPKAAMRVANRLLEAHDRNFWSPDAATLAALRAASDDLEDRLEGITAAPAHALAA
ncbi:magnesium chelatase subunit H [Polymorphobacter sp. PAMC 29334]|uniref:magnesium chelatase subunit H n=1 Tax=Polymorphobacter sp. PAMC 29334 TaxID=2862331 RepID=UPI00351CEAF3